MFANIVRCTSHGLQNAAEALLIGTLESGNLFLCRKKQYHTLFRQSLLNGIKKLEGNRIVFTQSYFVNAKLQCVSHTSEFQSNSSSDIQEYLGKHGITIQGNNSALPILNIADAKLPSYITSVLRKCNIVQPTPIQAVSWPIAFEGRDFVGISQTGSGKTLGYIVPAVRHIKQLKDIGNQNSSSPLVLVLVPTRELAQQIGEVSKLFEDESLKSACIYGGANKDFQLRNIKRGVDICIATPGRCLDFLRSSDLSLMKCSFLVLDEADRMLDMGFLPDIESIIDKIQGERQVLMWSATWHEEAKAVARKFLSDFTCVTVGSTELKPNVNVEQIVEICSAAEKKKKLFQLLRKLYDDSDRILIFAETRQTVDELTLFLRHKGFKVAGLHSGRSQIRRSQHIEDFRGGILKILVATAVASRGLDVKDISHIINYDCPKYLDEYIHKIGRTARQGKTGTAITFVTDEDTYSAYLIDILSEMKQKIPEELYSIGKTKKISFNQEWRRPSHFQTQRRNQRKSYYLRY